MPSRETLLSSSSHAPTDKLETRIRQKMRLHPLIRVIRESSALQRAARGIGHYAGLMSQFWRQLFGRGRVG